MKMKRQLTDGHKKILATAVALGLVTTGTFAWQSFDQVALNETSGISGGPGGRLHDDFNGTNKDIYVENYADASIGEDVFARIRLDEYMEYGEGAGKTVDRSDTMVILRGDKLNESTPELTDVNTWDTFLYGSTAVEGTESIRTFRKLTLGGSTYYMPTFNKDINSLLADINGTYAGLDGDRESDTKYDDYINYSAGNSETADARYAWYEDCGYDEVDDLGYYLVEETHRAKETLSGSIMSMETWKKKGSPVGKYWVYDVDGWAYWAQPIEPQTATGLLLSAIKTVDNPSDEWYYAVNVVSQIATAGDWGDKEEGTGMYEHGITADGLEVLNKAAGIEDDEDIIEEDIDDEDIDDGDIQEQEE